MGKTSAIGAPTPLDGSGPRHRTVTVPATGEIPWEQINAGRRPLDCRTKAAKPSKVWEDYTFMELHALKHERPEAYEALRADYQARKAAGKVKRG